MHFWRLVPVAAAALALLAGTPLTEASGPDAGPAFSPDACAGGELDIENGAPVLQVGGCPQVLGQAYGRLVGEQVRYLRGRYLERVLGSGRLKQLALRMARPMERHIPERHLCELGALAEAAGESREDVLLLATFLDVYRLVGCSIVVAVPPAGEEPLVARNLDFPTLGVAHRYSLVVVYHPEGFRRFLSVTWPGLPGVVSGMNEAGLVLVMSGVSDGEQCLDGIPYQLLYRRVLEECDTVEQAAELVRRAPRTMANNVVLLDGGGNAAVLEVTRNTVVRRGLRRGTLCATNHFRGPDEGGDVWPCRRYGILKGELSRLHGRLGVRQAAELLGMVHQGSLTMQSMIFEPGAMRVHLAFGCPPTTSRPYRTLDAGRLFRWRFGQMAVGGQEEEEPGDRWEGVQ